MKETVCIMCPRGCTLTYDGENVAGNKCKLGLDFMLEEIKSPKRVLTTTVKTIFPDFPVLPVKTNGSVPKGDISALMAHISSLSVSKRFKVGEVVVKNILALGVDLIATSDID